MSTPLGSPCVNVCRMDEATGWCSGCLRTLDEIAAWSRMTDDDRRAVWSRLAARRVQWRRLREQRSPPGAAASPVPPVPNPGSVG